MLKRLISFLMCALLVLQVPLVAYAETPGISGGTGTIPTPGDSGFKKTYNAAVWNDWGFRITLTEATPMTEEGIPKLEGQSGPFPAPSVREGRRKSL